MTYNKETKMNEQSDDLGAYMYYQNLKHRKRWNKTIIERQKRAFELDKRRSDEK